MKKAERLSTLRIKSFLFTVSREFYKQKIKNEKTLLYQLKATIFSKNAWSALACW